MCRVQSHLGKLAQVEEAVAVFSISVGLRLLICCTIHI